MTLEVRLTSGGSDAFHPYKGCASCGSTQQRRESRGLGKPDNTSCADCGATRLFSNDWDIMPTSMWEHTAEMDATGGLVVTRRGERVGYYPPGAWVSYRMT